MARLGYDRYLAQGGDWGSAITTAIGRQDPEHCIGIHLNMITVPPDPNAGDLTEQELSGLAGLAHYQEWDSGYLKQQATRPQTLGYGLADFPSGQAAWILKSIGLGLIATAIQQTFLAVTGNARQHHGVLAEQCLSIIRTSVLAQFW